MKILEVRDGFIRFEADESIYLSAFIQVDGDDKNYIAQVNQYKKIGNAYIADAKILFVIINSELYNYDKTLPASDSEIKLFKPDIIMNSTDIHEPIITGKLSDNSDNIVVDSRAFNKKMLISIDNDDNKNLLIRNLIKQFNNLSQKTIIIDTLGIHKEETKYFAGKDFKLPLDTNSLKFMYQSCLSDATQDSKSTIIEIFKDLAEYSETVPFVPFDVLKSTVDDMVDKQYIFKLFVLKNKLAKYKQLGYFATQKYEVESLNKILSSDNCIIDLSRLDPLFLNRYLEYIYSVIEQNNNIQVVLEVSNSVSKKNLKHILSESSAKTVFSTHSTYQYLNDIQNMFNNFILEPTKANNTTFKIYNSFFNSMPENSYLIAGEALNYIPYVSNFQAIEETLNDNQIQELYKLEEPEEQEDIEQNEEELEDNTESNQILANIKEKSDNVINSITETLKNNKENLEEIEIFDDSEEQSENITEVFEEQESVQKPETASVINDEIIEPEYNTVEEDISYEGNDDLSEEDIEDINIDTDVLEEVSLTSNDDSESQDFDSSDDSESAIDNTKSDDTTSDDIEISLLDDNNLLQELEEDSPAYTEIIEEETLAEETVNNEMQTISFDEDDDTLEEIVELDPADTDNSDIIIDISDEADNINIDENTDKQIVEDVDKVFTTIKEDNNIEEISDSDLDFIDELNSDENEENLEEFDEELQEISDLDNADGILEPTQDIIINEEKQLNNEEPIEILEKRESNTPIVPVYDADIPQEDMVISDPIQQGDAVIHAKYGNGVVEKMIKYGSKTLFSINFENIGRRLLDPTLTEIKKL